MGVINGFNVAGVNAICDGFGSTPSLTDTETIIETYSINANYFKEGDIFQIQAGFSKTNGSSLTARVYWNDTPDLVSAARLLTCNAGSSENYLPVTRIVAIVSSTTSLVYSTSASIETDFGDAAGNELTSATETVTGTNWSQDGYFVVTLQDNASGTFTQLKHYFTVII